MRSENVIPTHFSSWGDYLKFVFAKGFYNPETEEEIAPSTMEKISQKIYGIFQKPIDMMLTNIKEPWFIAGINIVGVTAVTVAIYPDQSFEVLKTACSPFFQLEPGNLKSVVYGLIQTTIFGLWARTMARLNDSQLVNAWEKREILPIHLGSIEVKKKTS